MNHLLRELAPITDVAWGEIDEEAARALKNFLSGRRIVDFEGPLGWDAASVTTGRRNTIAFPDGDVYSAARESQPLVELRADFVLSREELDAIERGAKDADLEPVVDAARRIAFAEDTLIFEGSEDVDIEGVAAASEHPVIEIGSDYNEFPTYVVQSVAALRAAGVEGPYAVSLGPVCYKGVTESTDRGNPTLDHLKLITGGPVYWAPGVSGTVVSSLRGGDYRLIVGEDLSIGYSHSDAESVHLYIQETVTFSNDAPEAAVALRYPDRPAKASGRTTKAGTRAAKRR